MRPAHLAQDTTPDLPVFQHAVAHLAQEPDGKPEMVVWLRPTSPLRTAQDIDSGAVDSLRSSGADCLRSVCLAEHHPYWMKRLENDRLFPFIAGQDERVYFQRQLLPPAYRLNGAVDVTRPASVERTSQLFGGEMAAYVMPVERSLDMDSLLDFALAELLLGQRTALG